MRFSTDDRRLGVIVSPAGRPHMFQFQLVMNGQVLGDSEPCIIGSAMKRLSSLRKLSDDRLSPGALSSEALMGLLEADEELHDATTLSLAESLDSWLLRAYEYEGQVVFVGRRYRPAESSPELVLAVVDAASYSSLIAKARSYWHACNAE